jgi:predicted transcriptional regulator
MPNNPKKRGSPAKVRLKSVPCSGEVVNRFFRNPQPSLAQLGPLEQRLLQEVWNRGSATVREIIDGANLGIAYTTAMTTLDRLYKKRILTRKPEGRAFRYVPRVTREDLQRTAAEDAIRQLLSSGSAASLPLSYLVEAVTDHDRQLLDELQQLVEKKRRELRSEGRP